VLDPAGRLFLADAELRPILGGGATAAGSFGGDVASLTLPCAGALVLAASSDVNPPRDRITMLRMENDALLPGASVELDGAVRRLKTLPPAGELRRVLAVAQSESGWRIDEIEVRCPQ
jgi:hypothetical protein